jgi:(S)-ureidoglycine aminohydrolase
VHNLGHTRSSQQSNHVLLTPDTFVRTTFPGMKACAAVVHASPAMGARFTQYTAEFEAGGELGETTSQRFLYVIEGKLTLELDGRKSELAARGCAYLPQGAKHKAAAPSACRAAVIEKPYEAVDSVEAPRVFASLR